MPTAKRNKRQSSDTRYRALKLTKFDNIVTAVNRSGDGEAILQVRDAIVDFVNVCAPLSAEKLAERIGDVLEDPCVQEPLFVLARRLGFEFERGRMSAHAGQVPQVGE